MDSCPYCHTQYPPENAYCEQCGYRFDAPPSVLGMAIASVVIGAISNTFIYLMIPAIIAIAIAIIALIRDGVPPKQRNIIPIAILGIILGSLGIWNSFHPWPIFADWYRLLIYDN